MGVTLLNPHPRLRAILSGPSRIFPSQLNRTKLSVLSAETVRGRAPLKWKRRSVIVWTILMMKDRCAASNRWCRNRGRGELMRFLILTADYSAFIRWFYTQHRGLEVRPYA